MVDFGSRAVRILLEYAATKREGDAVCCERAFHYLEIGERLRSHLRALLALHGLSELQFAILVILNEGEDAPMNMAQLADNAGVSRSAVTDAVDKLECRAYVNRIPDACDRRVTRVQISHVGRALASRVMDDYLHVMMQNMEGPAA